jgi:hypothetical protein
VHHLGRLAINRPTRKELSPANALAYFGVASVTESKVFITLPSDRFSGALHSQDGIIRVPESVWSW